MDLIIIIEANLSSRFNNSSTTSINVYTFLSTTKLMLDVLSCLSFLFLILYRHFKKLQCDDLHAPIFNQLFGVSAVCVLINLLALTVRILWEAGVLDDNTALFVVCVPAMFQFYSHSGVFCCIVSFSFLSAVQRIIILYFPDLKFLVTG